MINLFLVLLLIHSVLAWLIKPGYRALYCGLFGFIGSDMRRFDSDKFNILGLYNDSRGGDACGRVIDNLVEHSSEYGFRDYKDYGSYYDMTKPKKFGTVIGHTRKASVGGHLKMYTQPFVIRNPKSLDKVIYAGAHNGTLHNYEELAEMYKLPKMTTYVDQETGESKEVKSNDTQVLLSVLMAQKDYSILEKYNGGAALVWHDRITNSTYLFRGVSKKYASGKPEEERPLYLLSEGPKTHWFSSMEEPLMMIAKSEEPKISMIDPNTVYVFKKGELVDKFEVNRSEAQQNRVYKTSNQTGSGGKRNDYGYDSNFYDDDYYGRYSGYGDYPSVDAISSDALADDVNTLPEGNENAHAKVLAESIASSAYHGDKVYFSRFLYYHNGRKCHGIYHLDAAGNVRAGIGKYTRKYQFFEGLMLQETAPFYNIVSQVKKLKSGTIYMGSKLDELLYEFVVYPFVTHANGMGQPVTSQYAKYRFNGTVSPLFSQKDYRIVDGNIMSVSTRMVYNNAVHKANPENLKGEYYYEKEAQLQIQYNKAKEDYKKHKEAESKKEYASDVQIDNKIIVYRCHDCDSELNDEMSLCFCGGKSIKIEKTVDYTWETCAKCDGTGTILTANCEDCGGIGLVPVTKDNVILKIKAGEKKPTKDQQDVSMMEKIRKAAKIDMEKVTTVMPKKSVDTDNPSKDLNECIHCKGTGTQPIGLLDGEMEYRECDFCHGTGEKPKPEIDEDEVMDEMTKKDIKNSISNVVLEVQTAISRIGSEFGGSDPFINDSYDILVTSKQQLETLLND